MYLELKANLWDNGNSRLVLKKYMKYILLKIIQSNGRVIMMKTLVKNKAIGTGYLEIRDIYK